MTREKVVQIISEVLGREVDFENTELEFSTLPDWDSLAFIRIIGELEEAGAAVDIEKFDAIKRLADLYEALGL